MKLAMIGFFSDLPYGDPADVTLRSVIGDEPSADEARLVSYLQGGRVFIASPGVEGDLLADGEPIIGPAHVLTDGTWAWPATLAYYVERYHARVPDAFVAHARSNGWTVPSEIDLERLEL